MANLRSTHCLTLGKSSLSLREERNRLSWLHLEKEGNSILHFQWTLDHVPGSHGDNIPTAELPSRTALDSIPRFPIAKKNVIIPYVVNHLCHLYGTHWCRLQYITSWPFWLWIMGVTWLHLPLTFSRLGLKNSGMGAWACTLKLCEIFTKVSRGPWLKRKLYLGPTIVKNYTHSTIHAVFLSEFASQSIWL